MKTSKKPGKKGQRLEKGLSSWYTMIGQCEKDVKEYFKEHPYDIVNVNLPNDKYHIISLGRSVEIRYIKKKDEFHDDIVVGVCEPIYVDEQFVTWYEHEIEFINVFQDAIILSDVMQCFYEETE